MHTRLVLSCHAVIGYQTYFTCIIESMLDLLRDLAQRIQMYLWLLIESSIVNVDSIQYSRFEILPEISVLFLKASLTIALLNNKTLYKVVNCT